LIYGTGVDPEPAGLETLANDNPLGVLTPAGTTITLADLDTLIEGMRPWDGGQLRAFVMNRGQYAAVSALAWAAGSELHTKQDPLLDRPLSCYQGVPILVSDWITDAEAASTTSIYMVHLGHRDGEPQFGGLVWFYNEDTGAGIRVDGPHRTSAAADLLYVDLDLNIGFGSLSTGAVLRMSTITP
jgi:hypothetical protein